jgi:hypothetical protein
MLVEIRESNDEFRKNNEYRDHFSINVDGKERLSFTDGESEDNSLCRNFNDIYGIADLLIEANEAGLNGKQIKILNTEVSNWDQL